MKIVNTKKLKASASDSSTIQGKWFVDEIGSLYIGDDEGCLVEINCGNTCSSEEISPLLEVDVEIKIIPK